MRIYITTLLAVLVTVWPLRAAEYAVATNGDDANVGSAGKSFRTIQRAADVMKAGDTCRIAGGTYRETITVKASGRAGEPVRFVGAPGQVVTISGAERVKARWTVHKGRIYKASVKRPVGQLFIDGEMMVEARWPNQPLARRWDQSTWRKTFEGSKYGTIVDPELAKTGIDWTGAMGVLNVGSWQTFLRPVVNHAKGKASFEYARDLGKRHDAERIQTNRTREGFDRYFLYGKLEALDAPGEWFHDSKSGTLYVWPLDGRDPSGRTVEGKTRQYGFIASGKSDVQLDGVRLFASTVLLDECTRCELLNCRIDYPTYAGPVTKVAGVRASFASKVVAANETYLAGLRSLWPTMISGKGNVVRNCRITFSEAPGLFLDGSGHVVENCLIHDVDWRGLGNGVISNCAGVMMGRALRSVFRRNTVHHVGSSEGVILPHTGPSVCEYNYVHDVGFVQSDGGLIQCSSLRQNGSVIRYNWVHDHHAFNWGGIGIRGDDLTRDLIIHHNVAWRCAEKGIIVKGDRNQVYNNTCVDNPSLDLILWAAPEPFKPWAKSQHAHLLKQQNANSKAYNNYAPVLTGQMHHEVRRAKKVVAPVAAMSHNLGSDAFTLVDVKTLKFRKSPAPLARPGWFDFRPAEGSALVDAGRVIEGFTPTPVGKAPDVGAYERGAKSYWIPGYQAPQASMAIPPNEAKGAAADAELIWLAGYRATSCDVYFGSSAKAVAAATRASDEFKGSQANNIHRLAALRAGQTYYWRIDSVTLAGVVKGEVWQFTVEQAERG